MTVAENSRPGFHILICLIQIWDMKNPNDPMAEPDPSGVRMITEVQKIEIEDSYRKLIGTASVKFPIGTVIRRTLTETGGGEHRKGVTAVLEDAGALIATRADSKKAELADFRIGSRIRISLGLTADPKVAALTRPDFLGKSIHNDSAKLAEYKRHLTNMFDGYVVKCSIDYPIELRCENLASRLKRITCPKVEAGEDSTVNDFLSSKGKHRLLENSGLSLYPGTEKCEIHVGRRGMTPHLSVADILTTWAKWKLFSYVKFENGKPYLAVGRSYFSNPGEDSLLKKEGSADVPEISFDYHVASNDLTLMGNDAGFLAVEASGLDENEKFYRITIKKNLEWDESQPSRYKWQILNETTLSKKSMKAGATPLSEANARVDLSAYNIIPYMSRKIGVTHEELLDEAIKYYESYNMNGVEGSLTLFGDLSLKSATVVRLNDRLYPQKNGRYFVDEVHTTFGVDGYRQKVKLPYCISRDGRDANG